jgi:hypothetical protein
MNAPARRAWREPLVWLVAALPAASIAAGIVLLVLAGRSGTVDAVADPVQRTAQVQVTDLRADVRAREAGLSAIARRSGDVIEVRPVAGAFDRRASLTLVLRHPVEAARDRTIVLAPMREGWRARMAMETGHDWILSLAAADGRWRLQGRWRAGASDATLQPALRPVP